MDEQFLRLAIFASGSGSNLEAILEAIEHGTLAAEVTLVISNKSTALALERAARRHIPTVVLDPSTLASETDYVDALFEAFSSHGVNFIALAGYLKKIPAAVVQQFQNRMLNIHPSLLPSFGGPGMYGSKIHKAAIERGVRWSGVTIHLVDEHYDSGPIVLQKPVPVYQDDTPDSLASRILAAEHRIYPEALQLFAEGRVQVVDRKVAIDPQIPTRE